MSTSIFLRLWTRAPRTAIQSWAIKTGAVARGQRVETMDPTKYTSRDIVRGTPRCCANSSEPRASTPSSLPTPRSDDPGTARTAGRNRRPPAPFGGLLRPDVRLAGVDHRIGLAAGRAQRRATSRARVGAVVDPRSLHAGAA